ncbi:coiled-coil domain-containing protein 97 [Astyanax mexicanus]|uniref:coiled-coil domain-containing protein 97 n=1 Tax=Astyanax mexicanus TaxID=7994 RepID=UPI0020CADF4F|nr:coiled-coil domain-containing protein 97 [Astyanax mexicanus]XP_049331449.1 coiled-coil domain-containing protein 97 [Astyanax mexicanus]XP_049331450.1 coiled-coil domain-containing protein 97 [Astyanax mexicanus]
MWGEIEPSFRPQSPETFENDQPLRDDQEEEEEEDEDEGDDMMQSAAVVCAQSTAPKGPGEVSSCGLSAMIEAIASSGSPVKSQQLGEPDLSVEEKKKVLLEQYETKPLVFLERYHAHMQPEHLEAFSHLSSDCRAQYYCTEVQKRASCSSNRTRVRNHRYAALRALQKEGQYFSEEQMRFREPLLYEQYIGQYLSDEEILQRSEQAMQQGPACLSDLLISSYQEKQLQNRLQEEQDREQCAEEEEEEEEEEENNASRQAEWEPSAEEKAMLREEFLSQMHQRFLDGKDRDFNYSEVDENPDYDNLDILNRDAEERYFDDDDDNDEEEEGD